LFIFIIFFYTIVFTKIQISNTFFPCSIYHHRMD
jgi:hypothetical protein